MSRFNSLFQAFTTLIDDKLAASALNMIARHSDYVVCYDDKAAKIKFYRLCDRGNVIHAGSEWMHQDKLWFRWNQTAKIFEADIDYTADYRPTLVVQPTALAINVKLKFSAT